MADQQAADRLAADAQDQQVLASRARGRIAFSGHVEQHGSKRYFLCDLEVEYGLLYLCLAWWFAAFISLFCLKLLLFH